MTLTEQPPAVESTCNTISQQAADFFLARGGPTTTIRGVAESLIESTNDAAAAAVAAAAESIACNTYSTGAMYYSACLEDT